MDSTPAPPRDRDPIEAVLFFLLRNWILLVSLPVIAGVIAFAMTFNAPRTFTLSISFPAPPVPIAAFDDLWSAPDRISDWTVSADGSILLSSTAATEVEAREPVDAAEAVVQGVAAEAIESAVERQTRLSDLETRLLAQAPPASLQALADQATALSVAIQAAEAALQKTSALRKWSRTLDEREAVVVSSNGSSRIVPFAVFGAFTLALAIAITRLLLSRMRNGRHAR